MTHTDADGSDAFRACTRKRAYPTEDIAKLGVASIVRHDPTAEVRAYACRRCGLWHVGRTPSGERRPAAFGDDDDAPRDARPPRRVRRRAYGHSLVRRSSGYAPRRRDDE